MRIFVYAEIITFADYSTGIWGMKIKVNYKKVEHVQ